MSQIVKIRLTKTINKHMKSRKLGVILQTSNRLINYYCFKDFVPETLRSTLIYQFLCRSCTASYIGKTYRHFKARVPGHQRVSPRTGKPVKSTLSISVVHEDFTFLGSESNRYLLKLKDSLFIKRDKPSLNKNLYSQELFLFWVFHIG